MTPQLPPAQIARAAAVRVAYDVTDYGNVPALLDVAEWILHGVRQDKLAPLAELADELDAKVRAGVADVLRDDDNAHTWVVAQRKDDGREWCRIHDVPPYAAHTHIVSTPESVHGHAIRPSDRVVFVGDLDMIADDVRFAVQLAQRAGGAL